MMVDNSTYRYIQCSSTISRLLGGSMAPEYNPSRIPSLSHLPPSPPGGTTTTDSLPTTTGPALNTISHPAGKGNVISVGMCGYNVTYVCLISLYVDIVTALRNQVDAIWRRFGNFLYVDPALMDTIEMDNQRATDRMLDLVTKWVAHYEGTGGLPRTWPTMVKAVRDSGHGQLAIEVAEKHGVTLTRQ